MNVLSLFDGMSCGRIALDRAGLPVTNYYASEIDKYAIQVSKANWPDIEHVGDVTKLESWYFPKIDLLIGGSPCQGFSFAGKQLNFSDPRSKLFFEFVRLLKQLRERNPKVKFLLENVVMKKEYQDVISEALGVKPVLINSALVSAQNRKRLYWTNIPFLGQPADKKIIIKDILEQEICYGETPKSDKLIKLGNSHPSGNGMNGCIYDINGKAPTVTTNKGEGNKIGVKQINPSKLAAGRQPYMQDRVYHTIGKTVTLTAEYGSRLKVGDNMINYRKLTVIECERLQNVPDGYTSHISDTQAYKMLGNGWNVDTIVHLFQGLKCDWF